MGPIRPGNLFWQGPLNILHVQGSDVYQCVFIPSDFVGHGNEAQKVKTRFGL